jgi:uncharacterized protein YkwD
MVHKPIAIMILPVIVTAILMLAILTATGNAQESSNTGSAQQETSKVGTCNKIFCENPPQKHESSNTGTAQQESNNTGNAAQESSNTGNGRTNTFVLNPPTSSQESSNTGNAVQGASNNGNTADLAKTILEIHNRERAAVSIPPLVWSDELAAEAKTWAEHLARTGEFAHDTAIFHTKGENIAQGAAGFHSTEQLIQGWVNEKKNWHGAPVTDENLYSIGHYVQMVSPATTHVGCATASGGGKVDLVCRYDRSLFPKEPYIPSFLSRPAG